MTALRDTAKAKLNLTLEVLGRRDDGYHEVQSLVVFAALGDGLELEPGEDLALAIDGPFAGALSGGNLVTAAAKAAKSREPAIELGHFRLTKILPVAAGLGGGSADAAASLRLLARANGALADSALGEIAARLGSDVTACLQSRPALMTGRGEKVTAIHGMPACGVVLVNPGLPLTAASVYGALRAAPLSGGETDAAVPDFAGSFERLIDYAAPRGNHLEAAALHLAPVIGEVLAALRRVPGARLVQLAGSGPTCFALFATEDEAKRAAASLKAANSPWWVAATRLEASAD
jgi:4-diphosphocytidyl-2-C-methyl-D-erythritol kinase